MPIIDKEKPKLLREKMASALADLAPSKVCAYKKYMSMDYNKLLSMYEYACKHVPSPYD